MSDSTIWHDANAAYLSAALVWLRERFASRFEPLQHVTPTPTPMIVPAPQVVLQRSFWHTPFKMGSHATATPVPVITQRVADAESAIDDAPSGIVYKTSSCACNSTDLASTSTDGTPQPALLMLAKQLGLSPFEQDVLLLCVAMELDSTMPAQCARANGDLTRAYPTFALAMTLFDEPAWEVVSPQRPLRYWRLLEINQSGSQPLVNSALRADERIVNFLRGLNYLDDRLAPLVTPINLPPSKVTAPASQTTVVERIVTQLKHHGGTRLPVVQLLGSDVASKELVAQATAQILGLQLYRMPVRHLHVAAGELETIARLWQRESLLLPLTLYIDLQQTGVDGAHGETSIVLSRFLSCIDGMVFVDSRDPCADITPNPISVDISKPTATEQQAIWRDLLGDAAGDNPARLAGQFDLNFVRQQQLAAQTLAQAPRDDQPLHTRLWDACLASTRPQIGAMAQQLDPKAHWEDLILPPLENSLLHQIAAQVGQRATVYGQWGFRNKMNRGLGISTLFAGESGTGKTMAAEVIANDLRLHLYRIDLSAVVSKYIGETEKNLRRLFDAAEDGGAILFFDEADALFGKRSEVKDSHDRYANIETNYLLQRMESYRGLAILATNMKSALDAAFLRRLRFVVNFPFPGAAERQAIWRLAFPLQAPTDGLDFARLARLNLTGGHIHNIAINAAFLAARASSTITMPIVLDAARTEFRKLERPINEAEFRWPVLAGVVS